MKNIYLLAIVFLMVTTGVAQKKEEIKHNKETNLIEATYFHDNGQISQMGTFDLKGKLHGEWVSFNELGEKVSEGAYINGKRTGKWIFWDKEVIREVEFNSDGIASVVNKDPNTKLVIRD